MGPSHAVAGALSDQHRTFTCGAGRQRTMLRCQRRRKPGSRRTTVSAADDTLWPARATAGGAGRPDVRNAAPDVRTTTSSRANGEMISLTAAIPRNGGSVGSAASASSAAPASSSGVDGLGAAAPRQRPLRATPLPRAGARARRCRSLRSSPRAPPVPGGTRDRGPAGAGGGAHRGRRRRAHPGDRLLGLRSQLGGQRDEVGAELGLARPGQVRQPRREQLLRVGTGRARRVDERLGGGHRVLDHRQRVRARRGGVRIGDATAVGLDRHRRRHRRRSTREWAARTRPPSSRWRRA